MSSKIRGVVPPLAIPLKDGELDVPSLERHINRMIEAGLRGVEFIAVNTDAQALLMSDADVKLDAVAS